ncbi:MAG: glycosyltransferase [Phycisphaerales bacterium]|nr:glycosyltransferase [Phycisphaerales bacterium]
MRVLLLADRVFAAHERVLIERIAVGLVAEGIDVHCALPAHRQGSGTPFTLARQPVVYNDRGLAFTRRIRAAQIARQVVGDSKSVQDGMDMVHVFGGSAWGMGRELGDLFGCPVAYEVWREGMVERAARVYLRNPNDSGFFAPDTPIEQSLIGSGVGSATRLTHWGASVAQSTGELLAQGRDHTVVLVSSGRDRDRCIAAFEGLVSAIGSREDVLIFVNTQAAEQGGIWKRAKQLGVLEKLTVVQQMEDRRDLVLRCDLMVYPDQRHEHRTILLDAMGHGLGVIAAHDDQVSVLINHETALLVESATSEQWGQRISELLDNPDDARRLGRSARLYIQQHRRTGVHAVSLVDAYSWMTESGSLAVR